MTYLAIHKAQPVGDQIVDDLSIVAKLTLPYNLSVAVAEQKMSDDAACLVKLLHDTLPQGTWSRVVAEIAQQWSSDQGGIMTARAWYPETEVQP